MWTITKKEKLLFDEIHGDYIEIDCLSKDVPDLPKDNYIRNGSQAFCMDTKKE